MAETEWRLGHRPGLDQLRGLAVLGAVWAHTAPGVLVGAGSVGVGVFFTLSGFLITRLLLEERDKSGRIDLRAFYVRRARRLLPALPVFAIVAANISVLLELDWTRGLLATATYSINYRPEGAELFRHAWSLAVEEHFYLFWPVVVMVVASRRRLAVIAVVVSAASAVLRVVETDPEVAYRSTHLRLDALLVGAVGAVVVASWRPQTWLVAVSIAVLGGLATFDVESFVGLPATVVALAALVVVLGLLRARRRVAWLERIGLISYGIYLYHYPVAHMLRRGWPTSQGSLWLYLAILGASVVLAEISYRLIEAPFRRRSGDLTDHHVGVDLDGEVRGDTAAEAGIGRRDSVLEAYR